MAVLDTRCYSYLLLYVIIIYNKKEYKKEYSKSFLESFLRVSSHVLVFLISQQFLKRIPTETAITYALFPKSRKIREADAWSINRTITQPIMDEEGDSFEVASSRSPVYRLQCERNKVPADGPSVKNELRASMNLKTGGTTYFE